ncbi:hypothetical protein EXS70_02900 [Candidatus Peribacteria bacterium]|nr:hypothetical protein [Candidatus Peribacteria bacterium]
MNLSYVLWAILGAPQKKFVILVGLTQAQAKQHLRNIKEELEHNPLLRADLGPFREEEDEWRNSCLVISNYGAKIMAVSIDQAVRGFRHGSYRPDLFVCDDIEDMMSVKTKEGRDKTYQWVKSELLPAGDTGTRIVFIGNLLHEDCLLKRLQREIEARTLRGIYREYPLVDGSEKCLWPGKYPTKETIEAERQRIGSDSAFYREYLLRILPDLERVIHREWICYYPELPADWEKYLLFTATGVDVAISQNESADFTAMVSAKVYRVDSEIYIFILPNPVNAHLTPLETLQRAKDIKTVIGGSRGVRFYVEEVGYQGALIEFMKHEGLRAEGSKVKNQDKRARLALASPLLQSGKVMFPRHGCEDLINQLVNFGVEQHDDLADAFAILLIKIMEDAPRRGGAVFISLNDDEDDDNDYHDYRDEEWRRFMYPDPHRDSRSILHMRF